MSDQRFEGDCTEPLDDEKSERRLVQLQGRVRALSRDAKKTHRRHEANVFISADESGRLTIRFRPDEQLD